MRLPVAFDIGATGSDTACSDTMVKIFSNTTPEPKEEKVPISRELLKKVRLLELRTRLQVRDVFGGQYHSVFKGQGMDFDEVREYSPGDDVRNIDWNVSARMDHPYIKVYSEERELTIMLLVDLSGSSEFGSVNCLKREIAAELTALLALCALTNNDKVGLILFTDKIEHFVAPKKGRRHILRLIRDVLVFKPSSKGTSISRAVEYSLQLLRKRSIMFLLSDMNDSGWEKAIRVAGRKHDFIVMELNDPREAELPDVGLIPLADAESDEILWVDSSSKAVRSAFQEKVKQLSYKRESFFKSHRIDHIAISTGKPYIIPLIQFFRQRGRRR